MVSCGTMTEFEPEQIDIDAMDDSTKSLNGTLAAIPRPPGCEGAETEVAMATEPAGAPGSDVTMPSFDKNGNDSSMSEKPLVIDTSKETDTTTNE